MLADLLPSDFNLVLRSAVVIGLVYQATGFLVTHARHKYFNKTQVDQFKETHQKYFNSDPVVGGYPDCGDGRYADKLSFADWHSFNNAVRAYNNFGEMIVASILSVILVGLFFPPLAAYSGFGIAFGRVLYAVGYLKGPGYRMLGAEIAEILIISNLLAVASGIFK